MTNVTIQFNTEVTYSSIIEVDEEELEYITESNVIIKRWNPFEKDIFEKLLSHAKPIKIYPSFEIINVKDSIVKDA
jgi:hypothetical protein